MKIFETTGQKWDIRAYKTTATVRLNVKVNLHGLYINSTRNEMKRTQNQYSMCLPQMISTNVRTVCVYIHLFVSATSQFFFLIRVSMHDCPLVRTLVLFHNIRLCSLHFLSYLVSCSLFLILFRRIHFGCLYVCISFVFNLSLCLYSHSTTVFALLLFRTLRVR